MFGPYWRAWQEAPRPGVEAAPGRIVIVEGLDAGHLPAIAARSQGLPGGEAEARRRADGWLAGGVRTYASTRDAPAVDGTSRLSPYLRFGCLSAAELAERARPGEFLRQLCWRDFAFQLLRSNPDSEFGDMSPTGAAFDEDGEALEAWRVGLTGYPLVDAGMRQLAAEGWMHNRVRMVVASFLTKHLNVDWRSGAHHFDRLLVDGDPANNAFGWQWVAGTGVDTRPGRMFNPTLQARRFDPEGTYVRRYVPELAGLPADVIHEPWKLAGTLEAPDYPPPIVDHATAFAAYRGRLAAARGQRPS